MPTLKAIHPESIRGQTAQANADRQTKKNTERTTSGCSHYKKNRKQNKHIRINGTF